MLEILLGIGGIVFGGGMIGKLIIFFIKRYDNRNCVLNKQLNAIIVKINNTQIELNKLCNKIAGTFINVCDTLESAYTKKMEIANQIQMSDDKDDCSKLLSRIYDISSDTKKYKEDLYHDTARSIRTEMQNLNALSFNMPEILFLKDNDKKAILFLINEYDTIYLQVCYDESDDPIQYIRSSYKNIISLMKILECIKLTISNFTTH